MKLLLTIAFCALVFSLVRCAAPQYGDRKWMPEHRHGLICQDHYEIGCDEKMSAVRK